MESLFTLLFLFAITASLSQETLVKRLKINSPKDDFCPHLYKNGMSFTSNRKNSVRRSYYDSQGIALPDIYFVTSIPDTKQHTSVVPFKWNTIDSTEGCATVTPNGQTMYFAKTIAPVKKKKVKKYTKIGLMKTEWENGDWTEPVQLSFNNHRFNFSQPYWDESNNRLYFASDIRGGKGGMDIWYVTKLSETEWSDPVNLGSKVNSKGDEVFPTLNSYGVLFFSSEKKSGYGGYDIYSYDPDIDRSHKLPKPINSSANDYSFIYNHHGNDGYLVSDRWGDQDDIYSFSRTITFPDSSIQSVDSKKCYTFFEENPPPNADEMAYQWNFGDGTTAVGNNKVRHCYEEPGIYQVTLSIQDTYTGITLANVAQMDLNIELLAEYSLHSENLNDHQLKVVFEENKPENNESELYWKYEDTIYFDLNSLIIEPNYFGEYRVDAYVVGDVKEVAIFKIIFFSTPSEFSNTIKLVPSNFEKNNELHDYFDQHPSYHNRVATLLINEHQKNRHHIWLSTIVDQFKSLWGIDIQVSIDNSSEHLRLYFDEK